MASFKSVLGLDRYDEEKKSSSSLPSPVSENAQSGSSKKKWIGPTLAVGVLAVTAMTTSSINSSRSNTLSDQQGQITSLKSQIDVANLDKQSKSDKVNSQIAGLSSERQDGDDNAIRGLMTKATTWGSYTEYVAARDSIKKQYGLDDKSSFLTNFMPKIGNLQDGAGHNYNEIDVNNLNVRLKGFSSSVTKIGGLSYTYIGLASVESRSANKGTSTTYTVVQYTTDAAHHLKNVQAYPILTQPIVTGSMKDSTPI